MKVVKCSASAIKTYYHCSFKYWLEKILGMESPSGKAALQGTIVHQVFEWMSKFELRNKKRFDPMWMLEKSWNKHTKLEPSVEIRRTTSRGEAADFKKCRLSVEKILDSDFSPYKSKIIDVERWFEIEIPGKEWSCQDGHGQKHQLTCRGRIDLVREIDSETIEIIDWKTGKREDFYTRRLHDFTSLMHDIQVRLYHLAVTELYPQYKNILVTIHYVLDGGPITIPLTREDIIPTISALWKFFDTIKKDSLLIRNRSWTCRMCSFGKSDICQRVWSDFNAMGYGYTKDKYSKMTYEDQKKFGKPVNKTSD